jgi:dTDP-4-amino-4,6-dideoxygalactose transaminase
MAALQAMELPEGSEVITTPFSFAASTTAISAVGLKPVFADVDPTHLTLDPVAVERKITSATSCVLPVHVYGFPAAVDQFDELADRHNLSLVYDAAHAFNARVNGRPIASFGSATMFSFHATKLFNTIEGGCVCINSPDGAERLRRYRNFGIKNEERVDSIGINGKMSEVHALFGLLNLDYIADEIARRRNVKAQYDTALAEVPNIGLFPAVPGLESSFQYYPIRVLGGLRDVLHRRLRDHNVFARKYFYPLIADFDQYRSYANPDELPHARAAAQEVLCLPFFGDLSDGTATELGALIATLMSEMSSAPAPTP